MGKANSNRTPAKYKSIPVDVEAMQLVGDMGETFVVCEWVVANGYPWLRGDVSDPMNLTDDNGRKGMPGIYIAPEDSQLVIRTLSGERRISYGDWVIKNPDGEFFGCDPATFQASYNIDNGDH